MDNRARREVRKNPQESANLLSLLFIGWTAPIFWKGSKGALEVKDLYDPLKSDESERLGDRLEIEWKKELMKSEASLGVQKDGETKPIKKPSLKWAIIRTFGAPYMLQGLLMLFQTVALKIMQPVLQGWVIGYFNPSNNTISQIEALIYAFLLIMTILGVIFTARHTNLNNQRIGMRVRIACCSLIYRKVLRLDQVAVSNTAAGKVINLISNDVARFDTASTFLHYIWIMPIQVTIIGYMMWDSVGGASMVGLVALIIQCVPVQGYLSNISAKLRFKIAMKTDERMQLMSEMISGIKVAKMYSWEKWFECIVSRVRELEIKLISCTSYLRGTYQSMMVLSEKVTLYLTLVTFVLMGNTLTAAAAFEVASYFNMLQLVCALGFPQGILLANVASVSVDRLTEFLLLDEIKREQKSEITSRESPEDTKGPKIGQQIREGVGIEMVNAAANWVHGQLPPTLHAVSLKVMSRSLSAIVGPVGAGKSSLLHLVLGELPVGAGTLSFFTGENSQSRIDSRDIRISYTSQDPWLFSASIRDNILFDQPFNAERYQEVTKVCALHKDFEQLPQGDLTFVGERGASLSGGQKTRVNLARAVYRDAEVYLFDDPLSAMDAHVGRHLFEECIMGFLKGKTRLFVTHQLQYLRHSDTVIVLNRGTVENQGTYEELFISDFDILDSAEYEELDEIGSTEENRQEDKKCKEFATNNTEESKDVLDEEIATGEMSNKVYSSYFLPGGNTYPLLFTTVLSILGLISSSGTDYWITFWIDQETLRVSLNLNKYGDANASYSNNSEGYHGEATYFAKSEWFDGFGIISQHLAIYIYTFFVIGCVLVIAIRNILFMRLCMSASRKIHALMFANLLQATMRFFNTNPCGRVLNRFSKDVGTMDETLPHGILETIQTWSTILGILIIIGITNNFMIIPTLVATVILYFLRKYFLKTAQAIKRLEGIEKSPVFSHLSSTLDGLTTIRSRSAETEVLLRREFDRYQDAHTSAWYLTIATANSFALFLELISCFFIACVCFSFILMGNENTSAGVVGLAISQSLVLTWMVQYGMKYSTEVIWYMTSVERVLQYTKLPKEGPFVTQDPPPQSWPSKGRLIFKDVTMRYVDNKPPVLKNLNLSINPGWKVGIVGRTGAGKTSLVSALFRLTGDGLEGKIVLDGIDTKSIGLHELRSRISIIPQEPILFSANLRHNLDPLEQHSDAELWNSLQEVGLGDAGLSLDFHITNGGSILSVGQRQLICLARAILRNNRVLVLDEATANVDRHTDEVIQRTIRRRFADCTILTIAHRLNTIMDSDRVLVMAGGRAVEFDHPHLLLQDRCGHFSKMLQQTGKAMAEKLAGIAKSAFPLSSEFGKKPSDDCSTIISPQM